MTKQGHMVKVQSVKMCSSDPIQLLDFLVGRLTQTMMRQSIQSQCGERFLHMSELSEASSGNIYLQDSRYRRTHI